MTWADVIATSILFPALAWLAHVDLRSYRLPDRGTLPLIGLGLLWSGWQMGGFPVESALGAAVGYTLFAGLGYAFFRLRGIEGLGLGDAKLLAAAGAWVGLSALPVLVLIAAGSALLWAVLNCQMIAHRIAFGPWICGAFALVWVWRIISG